MRHGNREAWDNTDDLQLPHRVVSRDVSPEAFMEELCIAAGGYGRFFMTLMLHYVGWWVAVVAVPAIFLDHHRCEVRLPYFAWLLYSATLVAMLAMAVLLELSMVQRLGLLRPGELSTVVTERRWQLPLLSTVIWKLDAYTDIVFIFIARDCGSSLWWASLATFVFAVIFGQLVFNSCFAYTDCDRELPASFGFVLLDFKLVNEAVRQVLPFDPDASDLPVGKPVTLRTASSLIGVEKIVGDIAQVSIQGLFLNYAKSPNVFVHFSVLCGILHGALALFLTLRACYEEGWSMQAQGVQMGTVLMPEGPQPAMQERGTEEGDDELDIRRSSASCAPSGRPSGSPWPRPADGSPSSTPARTQGIIPMQLGKSSDDYAVRQGSSEHSCGFADGRAPNGGPDVSDADMLDLL